MRQLWGAFLGGMVFALGLVAAAVMIVALTSLQRVQSAEEIASSFGVTIVWNTHLVPSCGSYGCHSVLTPNVIYVSPDLGDDTRRIVLHELGHVMQWRLGIPADECGADRFAAALGEAWGDYCALEERVND